MHFLVIVLAIACLEWMPPIYIYYNTFFFALLFWAIHTKERLPEPILIAAGIDLTAIALDIVCIFQRYPESPMYGGISRWFPVSLAFIILNIVLRPFTGFALLRLYYAKLNHYDMALNHSPSAAASATGSSLTSAIRKILFLDPMGGERDRSTVGIDPNGTYRAEHHVRVERKTSAPLTTVVTTTSVPNIISGPPPSQSQSSPALSSTVIVAPTAVPAAQSVHFQQPQIQPVALASQLPQSTQESPPTPRPRRQSENQATQKSDIEISSGPIVLPIIVSPLTSQLNQSRTTPKSSPKPHAFAKQISHSDSSNSDSDSDIPEPSQRPTMQPARQFVTDPETGETYQERMI